MDRCYYYSGSDQREIEWGDFRRRSGLVWGGILTYRQTETTETWFVGSQAAYGQHMEDHPRKIGPMK
jgi:hypothetical protein